MYKFPQIDWGTLQNHRRNIVSDIMKETDIDALVISGHDNIRYATDVGVFLICEAYDWFASIVTRNGDAYLFLPYVDTVIENPLPELPWVQEYIPIPSWVSSISQESIWIKALVNKLNQLGVRKVGIETLPFQLYNGLIEFMPEVSFKSVFSELAEARQVKHKEEIKLLRASATVASLGGSAGLKAMHEGATDFEVLAAVDYTMRINGAEFITHNVCGSGEAQLTSGWFPKGNRLDDGDAMFFDWGCYLKGGYGADMCRTGFIGSPRPAISKAYTILREAHQLGQDLARPGIKASDINKTVNNYLKKSGYPTTPYSIGHGVGLRACELPIIYRKEMMATDTELKEGMVIALEPETTVESDGKLFVLKLEDVFLVTNSGTERLTSTEYSEV